MNVLNKCEGVLRRLFKVCEFFFLLRNAVQKQTAKRCLKWICKCLLMYYTMCVFLRYSRNYKRTLFCRKFLLKACVSDRNCLLKMLFHPFYPVLINKGAPLRIYLPISYQFFVLFKHSPVLYSIATFYTPLKYQKKIIFWYFQGL